MSETFRNIRTNLQFMLENDKKVILVTSTVSGEGKSFYQPFFIRQKGYY